MRTTIMSDTDLYRAVRQFEQYGAKEIRKVGRWWKQ